jgi:hypothetical protein
MEIKDIAEVAIAAGTILLVLATFALVWATFRLVSQTRNLAEITRQEMAKQAQITEDSSDALIHANQQTTELTKRISQDDLAQRRRLATYDAWRLLRQRVNFRPVPSGGRSALNGDDRHAVAEGLRELEYFAAGAEREVFDKNMIADMSGSWILQRYAWARPYIDEVRSIRSDRPDLYSKIIWLCSAIEQYQRDRPPTTED